MTERCTVCGAEVLEGSSFCPACGAELDSPTAVFEAVAEDAGQQPPEGTSEAEMPALIVLGAMGSGERFYLDRPELTIGRSPESDIFLNDVTVSRSHARLLVEGSTVTVVDVGSLNGTCVNDEVVTATMLHTGDTVQIGRFRMVFLGGEVSGGSARS